MVENKRSSKRLKRKIEPVLEPVLEPVVEPVSELEKEETSLTTIVNTSKMEETSIHEETSGETIKDKKRKLVGSTFSKEQKQTIIVAVKNGLTTRKHDEAAREKLCQELQVDGSRLRHWINNHRAAILSERGSLQTTPAHSTSSTPPNTSPTPRDLAPKTPIILEDLHKHLQTVQDTQAQLQTLSHTLAGFKRFCQDNLDEFRRDILALTAELVSLRTLLT